MNQSEIKNGFRQVLTKYYFTRNEASLTYYCIT